MTGADLIKTLMDGDNVDKEIRIVDSINGTEFGYIEIRSAGAVFELRAAIECDLKHSEDGDCDCSCNLCNYCEGI